MHAVSPCQQPGTAEEQYLLTPEIDVNCANQPFMETEPDTLLKRSPLMRQSLVVVPDASGLPSAKVPFPCMWDLVEYLSYQRVVVSYQYHATHFTVSFP